MKRYLVLAMILGFSAALCPAGAYAIQGETAPGHGGGLRALEEQAQKAVNDDEMQEAAAEDTTPSFEVGRVVVTEAVVENEPAGETELFQAEADKAYVFLEARDISKDTEANVVWYRDEAEVARVALRLGHGPRWRTFSSKNINGLPGQWKVAIEDPGGNVLKTIAFSVE